MDNIKFAHFPAVKFTIGYQIDDENQMIRYSIANLHPADIDNRKYARNIVRGRLLKGGVNKNGKHRVNFMSFTTFTAISDGDVMNHRNIADAIYDFHYSPLRFKYLDK